MRFKATHRTFYNGRLYEKGDEIEAGSSPSRWFAIVGGEKEKKKKEERGALPRTPPGD